MRSPMGICVTTVLVALTVFAATVGVKPPMLTDAESDISPPVVPSPAESVDPFGAASPIDTTLAADPAAPPLTVIPEGTPAGQNPESFSGTPPFSPPTINPSECRFWRPNWSVGKLL